MDKNKNLKLHDLGGISKLYETLMSWGKKMDLKD